MCVCVCAALDFRIQTTKEEDFGLVLTTSTKASGTCLYWSWSSCLHPKTKREKKQHTTKNELATRQTYSIHVSPFKRLFPSALLQPLRCCMFFGRSDWTSYQTCVRVYIRCVLYTNKKIIDKNFSSIEIYWLCMNKLNPKAWWGRTFITTQLNKLFTIFI